VDVSVVPCSIDHKSDRIVERLSRELRETTHEKIQAAEYGLAVLEEKQLLQQRFEEQETEYETVRQELAQLKEEYPNYKRNWPKITTC
uniref:Bicaudal D homolog 2 (Drosophila) n=1 Tax=Neogobius melanostomus TaxID=47308 RepID=A0A8C6UF01_9GOBI